MKEGAEGEKEREKRGEGRGKRREREGGREILIFGFWTTQNQVGRKISCT